MDILKLLKQDHKVVLGIIEKIETSTRGGKTREQNYSKLKKEIFSHMQAEETTFYPFLLKEATEKDCLYEAFEEHRVVRLALPDIDSTDVSDEQWLPKFKVIVEMLKHHIEEEENEVFELAEDIILEPEISLQLAEDFKEAKKQTILV